MKTPRSSTRNRFVQTWIPVAAACAALVAFSQAGKADDRIKQGNADNLNLTTSWVGGTVPDSNDVGVWDDTVTGANTTVLGADLSWSGIRIEGTTETGLVRINPGNQLTLGADGIDLSNTLRNLFLNVTVNADVAQTWDVAAGRTLSLLNLNNNVILTGPGDITKTGAGTLSLSNNLETNDFTGSLTIAEGRLQVVGVVATPTGGNIILKDGVRVENGSTATSTVTLLSGTRVTHIDGNVTFVGTTGGTANNTRLVFAADRNTTRAVNLRTNVEINVENPLNAAGGGFVTIGGISESLGSHSLTKTGPGMLTLIRNTSSYTGGTFINEGILELDGAGAANRLPPVGNIVINGGTLRMTAGGGDQSTGGTLTLNSGAIDGTSVSTLTAASYTMDSGSVGIALAGTGGLTKNTAGTVNITSANTFSGGTTVNAGTLLINNTTGSGTGSGAVTVNSSGILGGSGTINGITSISGSLRPGNSIGTLTVANDVTWNGGVDWVFELGAGDTSDLLNITGASSDFLKGSGTEWRFDFAGSTDAGIFTLVQWGGTTDFDISDFSYTNLGGGNTGSFSFDGNSLQFTAIPEPGSAGLLVGGMALLLLARRRRG